MWYAMVTRGSLGRANFRNVVRDGDQGVTRACKFSQCGPGRWPGGRSGVQIFAMWNGKVVRGSLGRTNFRNVEREGGQGVARACKFSQCGTGRWSGGRSGAQIFAMWNGKVVRGSLGHANFRNVEREGGQGVARAHKFSQCGTGRWSGGRSGMQIFVLWTEMVVRDYLG